ncbi:hypothetical protein H6F73_11570 [Microcoleus sp. FACHB-68]|nr:hypothetical protein [Microcoleus sp. FACHB-68]
MTPVPPASFVYLWPHDRLIAGTLEIASIIFCPISQAIATLKYKLHVHCRQFPAAKAMEGRPCRGDKGNNVHGDTC